jgi:dihydroorotase
MRRCWSTTGPFGVVGLETALGVVLKALYHSGEISLSRVLELLTTGPARVFSLPGGTLAPGAIADVTIIDPERPWKVDPYQFHSRAITLHFVTGAFAAQ